MATQIGFDEFVAEHEPQLRRALVARLGMDRGREALTEALLYAWRHWDRVATMDNPVGYLYRVGTSRAPIERLAPSLTDRTRSARPEPWAEPQLEPALDLLSENQRVAVVLRHSFEWTYDEIAELLDISVSTVRNHLNRGLEKLRQSLEVDPS
ncbi:MAG: sigma-70 family RNA polymerase sigma factor [Actinomycetia bacterium]|nr:sigma-70 family RNA polymerase sigma factor [Actinomycetes bacterium]